MRSIRYFQYKKLLFFAFTIVITSLVLTGCEKDELDRQMEALCAKDGGNKVYETVALPADMFSESGQPFSSVKSRSQEGKLGSEYIYLNEIKILKEGDILKGEGRLLRGHIKIIRKSDSKLLGESIAYGRSGGDGFVLGHPSSNSCPKEGGPIEKSIFIKQ